MRTCLFVPAAVLAFAVVVPSRAAEKPRTAQVNQSQPKKVWTNEDLDRLHARGLITFFGTTDNTATVAAVTSETQRQPLILPPRLQDPEWYRQQSADLQVQLDKTKAELQLAQAGLAQTKEGLTQAGIAMDRGNVGVTPEAGIAIREAQVREIESELAELGDLARQNNVAPGALRS